MRMLLAAAAGLAAGYCVMSPQSASAWHEHGHMTVALIAYRDLPETTQNKLVEILQGHPHYDLFLASDRPVNAELKEWVVMRAAVWPDWVRHPLSAPRPERKDITRNFSRPYWHYVNKPIYLDGGNADLKAELKRNFENPAKKESRGLVLEKLPILMAGLKDDGMDQLQATLKEGSDLSLTAAQARAVAVCWVLHLVGDLQQPLHAATVFSADAPDGDHGGNGYVVRWGNTTRDLHTLWDGGFGWDDENGTDGSIYTTVDGMARTFPVRRPASPAAAGIVDPGRWADESFELANSKAYRPSGEFLPGAFVVPPLHRPSARELDPLPAGYADLIRSVAETRVALGGARLTNVLKARLP